MMDYIVCINRGLYMALFQFTGDSGGLICGHTREVLDYDPFVCSQRLIKTEEKNEFKKLRALLFLAS